MKKFPGNLKTYFGNTIKYFRPERSEYFSPGHSFRRYDRNDAPVNEISMQTVREGKLFKTGKFFRTELLLRNLKKQGHYNFVRNNFHSLMNASVRTIFNIRHEPRALPGAIKIYPFQGKEKFN